MTTTGEGRQEGELRSRITVTLSIFNFSTRFFVQIVENRETQLSSLFLGPGNIFFRKVMTETDLYGSCMAPEVWVIMHQIPRARFSAIGDFSKTVFVITFRKIVPRT
jgi:hypothetical protein